MKKTAILFPGQGSQYIGMGKAFLDNDGDAAAVMAAASEKCGLDLEKLCLEGPLEELTKTRVLQPAITAINVICWQQLKKAIPDFQPAFTAGHSLGECSALHAAGVLSVEDVLGLVGRRGMLMEREGERNPGGMRAVLGLTVEQVEELVKAYDGQGTVVIANHNTEKQIVISGSPEPLEEIGKAVKEKGGKAIPLKVSLANHSPLIAGATAEYRAFMETLDFGNPSVPVLFNITADIENDPATIKTLISDQITSRVRWFESIQKMIAAGVELFVELGPKTVLTGMMKSIVPAESTIAYVQADTPESLASAVTLIGS